MTSRLLRRTVSSMRQGSNNDIASPADRVTETATETMRRCAHDMLPRAGEISAAISTQVLANVAGLTPNGSAHAVKAVCDSTDQNIGAILATLAFGVPADAAEPPAGTQDLLRHTIAEDGDVTILLSAYRYGHALLWQLWSDHVADQVGDSTRLHDVLSMSSKHMFTFIDRSCERLVSDYRNHCGARPPVRGRSASDIIRDLLSGDTPIDETLASTVLRCDILGYHVALVLSPLAAEADMRAAADMLAVAAGAASRVTLMVGAATAWSWLTWPHPPSENQLESLCQRPLKNLVVGMGEVGRGREGFAQSHQQACDAERVARLSRNVCGGVARHRDVEFAVVLCSDSGRARRFAEQRLSTLMGDDPTTERLRETLLVYLNNGCRQARTAEILHVHPKTVSYRLAQAEQRLGHPLMQDVLDVGGALIVAQALMVGPDGFCPPPR